jgi:hypothetical protein
MTESDFYTLVRQKTPSIHWERVENKILPGQPDTVANKDGQVARVEFKLLSGNLLHLEPFQISWFTRHLSQGGEAFILARRRDEMLLWSCRQSWAALMQYCIRVRGSSVLRGGYGAAWTNKKLHDLACFRSEMPFNWKGLVEALFAN